MDGYRVKEHPGEGARRLGCKGPCDTEVDPSDIASDHWAEISRLQHSSR